MYRVAVLSFLVVLASCSNDNEPLILNEITYGDEVIPMSHGLIIDNGQIDDSHYNYEFYVADGSIVIGDDGFFDIDPSVTFIVYASFASQGTSQFNAGNFIFSTTPALTDRDIFVSPTIWIDELNGPLPGTAGSISISGSDPNYTITYDLIFFDKTLTGSFTGEFEIHQGPL